jgi:hypothetical protein
MIYLQFFSFVSYSICLRLLNDSWKVFIGVVFLHVQDLSSHYYYKNSCVHASLNTRIEKIYIYKM